MASDSPINIPTTAKMYHVRARMVPRYFWTSASIDVYLEGRCILETGGQMKSIGQYSSAFSDGGQEHLAELKWGKGRQQAFPYELWIDGKKVVESQVPVENWYMALLPGGIIFMMMFAVTFAAVYYLLAKLK